MQRTNPNLKVIFAVLVVALVVILAYEYLHRFVGDQGLPVATDQRLITNPNITSLPTVFTSPEAVSTAIKADNTSMPQATAIAEQTIQGVTVKLDWAYADETRVQIQFTVTGIDAPPGVDPDDIVGYPAITDKQGILAGSNSGGGGGGGYSFDPHAPVTRIGELDTPIDANKFPVINLIVDLPVGGVEAPKYAPDADTNPNAKVEFVSIPLVGNFHFEFSLPVAKGVKVAVGQTVAVNGVTMQLQSLVANPLDSQAHLCFNKPNSNDWFPDANIKYGNGAEYFQNGYVNAPSQLNYQCVDTRFEAPYDGKPVDALLTVTELIQEQQQPYSKERISLIQEELKPQGIEFKYRVMSGGGATVDILKRPDGMDEAEVRNLINSALEIKIEGPWVFNVNIQP